MVVEVGSVPGGGGIVEGLAEESAAFAIPLATVAAESARKIAWRTADESSASGAARLP